MSQYIAWEVDTTIPVYPPDVRIVTSVDNKDIYAIFGDYIIFNKDYYEPFIVYIDDIIKVTDISEKVGATHYIFDTPIIGTMSFDFLSYHKSVVTLPVITELPKVVIDTNVPSSVYTISTLPLIDFDSDFINCETWDRIKSKDYPGEVYCEAHDYIITGDGINLITEVFDYLIGVTEFDYTPFGSDYIGISDTIYSIFTTTIFDAIEFTDTLAIKTQYNIFDAVTTVDSIASRSESILLCLDTISLTDNIVIALTVTELITVVDNFIYLDLINLNLQETELIEYSDGLLSTDSLYIHNLSIFMNDTISFSCFLDSSVIVSHVFDNIFSYDNISATVNGSEYKLKIVDETFDSIAQSTLYNTSQYSLPVTYIKDVSLLTFSYFDIITTSNINSFTILFPISYSKNISKFYALTYQEYLNFIIDVISVEFTIDLFNMVDITLLYSQPFIVDSIIVTTFIVPKISITNRTITLMIAPVLSI